MTANTLVIGGGSRVAAALRRLYPGKYDFVRRAESPAALATADSDRAISSYEELTADDLAGYDTVISLVGTTSGTEEHLMAVNAELPRHFAKVSVRAGVSHFIALSSFSVFGTAAYIDSQTPLAPISDYGRSRLAGEQNIAAYGSELTCTIARCPLLYGAGDSKLERLIKFWCRIGMMPAPKAAIRRSMVHYELAARYLDEAVEAMPAGPGVSFAHFADPVPFEYHMVAGILSEASGKRRRLFTPPSVFFRLFAATAPGISRSLYSESVLDDGCNHFDDLSYSRLEQDIAGMASANRSNI